MASIKLGDRLLVVGCSDTSLIVALANKAGLTGRACILDESESVTTEAATAVEREGALVESFATPLTALPFEINAFDVVVIRRVLRKMETERRSSLVSEARRVLRPGGRCIVIEDGPRGGFAGLLRRDRGDEQFASEGGAEKIMTAVGFRAVRTLAEREGLIFVEGVKAGSGESGAGERGSGGAGEQGIGEERPTPAPLLPCSPAPLLPCPCPQSPPSVTRVLP
jgi:SAM-dependent methyltransferase